MPLVTWRFRTDPQGTGLTQGYAQPSLDDSTWETLRAGLPWEVQGHAGYDGVAFYRVHVAIPADWQVDPVRLVAAGVDDEMDVYVNGVLARHYGTFPDRSIYNMRTETEIGAQLVAGADNVIVLRVGDWGLEGGLVRHVHLRRMLPLSLYSQQLPEPVLPAHPDWVDLYWKAWGMAWEKVSFGTAENQLVDAYMDEGFNEQIYQWDSSFITLFGRYGIRLFPVMETLDNFYNRQRPDGYIQRVYSETTGGELGEPTPEEPMVNPPLFGWVEWEYYRFTGDPSRLARVVPVLEAYYLWLKNNLRLPLGRGLYYQTDLGSGMDNTPRGDVWQAGWADMSMEQALAAQSLARLSGALGDANRVALWTAEHTEIANVINAVSWHDVDGFYYDVLRSGAPAGVQHVGGFWGMLAGITNAQQNARLVGHLTDPMRFYRPHLFPTLAFVDPAYEADGHYWRGSVWAPTNYMVIKGLEAIGQQGLAVEAANNHLANLRAVYDAPPTNEDLIAPEERDGAYQTLWECYSAENVSPATRWDDTYLSRQDFVGWTGLGPIALLLETVVGLEVDGANNRIIWHLSRLDQHGARRLPLGLDDTVTLVAQPRSGTDAPVVVDVQASRAFQLVLRRDGMADVMGQVPAGTSVVTLP